MRTGMDHACLAVVLILLAGFAAPAVAQTIYTNDGAPTAREEAMRWFANRARYAPDKEKARLGGTYYVPGYLPPLAPHRLALTAARNHCEDMAVANAFMHNTPTGAIHYAVLTTPGGRLTAEGYSWNTWGENIAWGYANGKAAHEGWFLSDGHRTNMLKSTYIELGAGYFYSASGSYHYLYTQDFGRRSGSSEHFFTDTVFWDRNTNYYFDESEPVPGIEIYLKTNSATHSYYDSSSVGGGFAIPINTIPDGQTVEVVFKNATGVDTNISIALDFNLVATIRFTNGESYAYGTFVQPVGQSNVGFRSVMPYPPELGPEGAPGVSNDVFSIAASTLAGGFYSLQYRDNLTTGSWAALVSVTATTSRTTFTNTMTSTQRFYRVMFRKDL